MSRRYQEGDQERVQLEHECEVGSASSTHLGRAFKHNLPEGCDPHGSMAQSIYTDDSATLASCDVEKCLH